MRGFLRSVIGQLVLWIAAAASLAYALFVMENMADPTETRLPTLTEVRTVLGFGFFGLVCATTAAVSLHKRRRASDSGGTSRP